MGRGDGIALLPAAHGDRALAQISGESGGGRPKADDLRERVHSQNDTPRIAMSQCDLHRTDAFCIDSLAPMGERPADRLAKAREQAGYDSAAAFARAHDLPEPTYRSHENGSRALTLRAARQYGPLLGVSSTWLMFGDAATPNDDDLEVIADLNSLDPEIRKHYRELLRAQAQIARERQRREP